MFMKIFLALDFLGNKENKWVFCNNYFVLLKAISFGKVSGKFVEDFHLLNLILDIYISNNHIKSHFQVLCNRTACPKLAFHPKLCGNCAFPQNLNTRKFGEITVNCAVF